MENNLDKQYQHLLSNIIHFGNKKLDRTGTGTKSIFSWEIRHNMSDGFPLLTTKKMYFKGIVTELLWFLRGDTNIKYLIDNGCHIWDGDAYKNYTQKFYFGKKMQSSISNIDGKEWDIPTKEKFIDKIKTDDKFAKQWGELGNIYGKQWRNWMGYDQIANLINELKTNSDSRRLMVNAWNVAELDQMVLPPCHYGFQVYTRELSHNEREAIWLKNQEQYIIDDYNDGIGATEELLNMRKIPMRAISLKWNQRSVDTFLGLPFNIACYGLLLCILGEIVNMIPEELIGSLGDVHLYNNHIEQAKELMTRPPYGLPSLRINTEFWQTESGDCGFSPYTSDFNSLIKGIQISDFQIENYKSHPAIKAPLSN